MHPIHQIDGNFTMQSGITVNILNPTIEMIDLTDIVKSLSKICRFGGHLDEFYSVAQHSVLVEHLSPLQLKKAALIHDFSEAYLSDVIKPLKVLLEPIYGPIEERWERIIFQKFGVDYDLLKEVKPYDMQAVAIEYEYQFGDKTELIEIFKSKMQNSRRYAHLLTCWNHGAAAVMLQERINQFQW
jgi:hypothetical protein